MNRTDLEDRVRIIDAMMREGRQSFAEWGWVFVLWGFGHTTAAIWSVLAPSNAGLAWAISMTVCGVATGVGAACVRGKSTRTTRQDHTVGGIWWAFGTALALAWIVGGSQGLFGGQSFLFVFYVLVGAASFASGVALQLRSQQIVGGVWWGCGVIDIVVPGYSPWILIAAALLCEVAFGLLLMRTPREAPDLGHVARA